MATVNFSADSRSQALRALDRMSEAFRSRRQPSVTQDLSYRDTFEWLLFRDGSSVYTTVAGRAMSVTHERLDETSRQRISVPSLPDFASDLPRGSFRQQVTSTVSVRRLLPIVQYRYQLEELCILDRRGKTVARVEVRGGTARSLAEPNTRRHRVPSTLRILSLKGYASAAQRVVDFAEQELGLTRNLESEFETLLRVVGRSPADQPRSQRYPIDRSMRTDVAIKAILGALLETVQRNIDGVRRRLDTEFLHDARVAVRRQRSIVSQIPGVFDKRTTERLKRDLGWLGNLTGPARDLDVHLLEMERFESFVPREHRGGLLPLARMLERMRDNEQRRIITGYDSVRFSRWTQFLDALQARPVPSRSRLRNAALPIDLVSGRRILKAYRKLVRRGKKIHDDSPPEALHRLRIDAKKLRYLLEFFSGLFPRKEVKNLVRSLKGLQDNLGAFNDISIQQDTLRTLTLRFRESDAEERALVNNAVNPILEQLAKLQQRERDDYTQRFSSFTHPDVRAQFLRVFGDTDSPTP